MISLTVSLTGYTQTEYCLPVDKAKKLIEDAVKKRILDTALLNREEHIALLNIQLEQTTYDYKELVQKLESKYQTQLNIYQEFEKMSIECEAENKRLNKQLKKRSLGNYGLAALLLIVIGISIAN